MTRFVTCLDFMIFFLNIKLGSHYLEYLASLKYLASFKYLANFKYSNQYYKFNQSQMFSQY